MSWPTRIVVLGPGVKDSILDAISEEDTCTVCPNKDLLAAELRYLDGLVTKLYVEITSLVGMQKKSPGYRE